jgi:hypothetical protein
LFTNRKADRNVKSKTNGKEPFLLLQKSLGKKMLRESLCKQKSLGKLKADTNVKSKTNGKIENCCAKEQNEADC